MMLSNSVLAAAFAAVSLATPSLATIAARSTLNGRDGRIDFSNNLAYYSPSLHPRLTGLEVPLDNVHRRNDEAMSSYRKLAKRQNVTQIGSNTNPNTDGKAYTGQLQFPYGVASGDPYNTSVVLWTLPQKYDVEGLYAGNSWPPVCLTYQVSTSNNFNGSLAANGSVYSTWDVRFATKVVASGLQAYTQYYYRFISCSGAAQGASVTGMFKTLPNPDDTSVNKIALAVFSCSNLPFGFFNAYGNAANNSARLDYVQHVGDYIYEYANGAYGDGTALGRVPQPLRECASLDDYRDRYQSYRSDPDLQSLHQKLAWQAVWDDHEVADQAYNAGTADSNNTVYGAVNGLQFNQRRANAVRAYFEWMPIRQVDTDDSLRIWRVFQVGKLFDLVMLDTRNYNRSITDLYWNTDTIAAQSNDSSRSMTGSAQQNWFFSTMNSSSARGATWRIVAQQVVFNRVDYSSVSPSTSFDFDAWEGYRYQRRQIVSHIQQNKLNNTVILSGDSHASWVFDLTQDDYQGYNATTGAGAVGVEFGGSAVSSPSSYGKLTDPLYVAVAANLTKNNPSLAYAEGQLRGYFELQITPQSVTADYYGFYDQKTRNSNVTRMGTFVTDVNTNRLRRPLNNGTVPAFGSLAK